MITYTLNDSALLAASDALSVPDGGFTLDPLTLTPVRGGYAVSVDPRASEVLSSASVGDLLAYLVRWSDVLDQPGTVFGGWHDPADDRIYLDVSRVIDDRDLAIELAVEHDQLAVRQTGCNTRGAHDHAGHGSAHSRVSVA